jgi:hypothetical protein
LPEAYLEQKKITAFVWEIGSFDVGFEVVAAVAYNAVYSVEYQTTFRKNMSLPFQDRRISKKPS